MTTQASPTSGHGQAQCSYTYHTDSACNHCCNLWLISPPQQQFCSSNRPVRDITHSSLEVKPVQRCFMQGSAHSKSVCPACLGRDSMTFTIASSNTCGTEHQRMPDKPQRGDSSILPVVSSATTGRSPKAAPIHTTTPSMLGQDAEVPPTVLKIALRCSCKRVKTPYNSNAWQDFLARARLMLRYPNLIEGLTHSFGPSCQL